ncbi:hypothetical protein CMV_006870 [Castanea mollissima]|uniref:Uncharacterized protein n=1 Tax=Castanea mollissima TaxID=60419 RepID=A0A8J4RAX5_9ROSI|nr:hypothetical protein CMV_006870 [Castanea mollissima]
MGPTEEREVEGESGVRGEAEAGEEDGVVLTLEWVGLGEVETVEVVDWEGFVVWDCDEHHGWLDGCDCLNFEIWVARASAFTFGVVYGGIKLKVLKVD